MNNRKETLELLIDVLTSLHDERYGGTAHTGQATGVTTAQRPELAPKSAITAADALRVHPSERQREFRTICTDSSRP